MDFSVKWSITIDNTILNDTITALSSIACDIKKITFSTNKSIIDIKIVFKVEKTLDYLVDLFTFKNNKKSIVFNFEKTYFQDFQKQQSFLME